MARIGPDKEEVKRSSNYDYPNMAYKVEVKQQFQPVVQPSVAGAMGQADEAGQPVEGGEVTGQAVDGGQIGHAVDGGQIGHAGSELVEIEVEFGFYDPEYP
uniref:Uncharacterized protein n=1 Tax=Globodera pallida TaxID=36090 RepID=A0A183C360_GLOPA